MPGRGKGGRVSLRRNRMLTLTHQPASVTSQPPSVTHQHSMSLRDKQKQTSGSDRAALVRRLPSNTCTVHQGTRTFNGAREGA